MQVFKETCGPSEVNGCAIVMYMNDLRNLRLFKSRLKAKVRSDKCLRGALGESGNPTVGVVSETK